MAHAPDTQDTIKYYFSVFSPWAYFGDTRLRDLAKVHGKTVRYHPLLTPPLFPATGGVPLKDRAQPRQDYRIAELKRWRDLLGIEWNPQPKYLPVPEAPTSPLILPPPPAGEAPRPPPHPLPPCHTPRAAPPSAPARPTPREIPPAVSRRRARRRHRLRKVTPRCRTQVGSFPASAPLS